MFKASITARMTVGQRRSAISRKIHKRIKEGKKPMEQKLLLNPRIISLKNFFYGRSKYIRVILR